MNILLLSELELHPNSKLAEISASFERSSVIEIKDKEAAKRYRTKPAYDKYNVLVFKSFSMFKANCQFFRLEVQWPILLCQGAKSLALAKSYCAEKNLPYSVYVNDFDKEQAYELIERLAEDGVSKSFSDALITQVGLSPKRIINGMAVCSAVGYTVANVKKYVDRYRYYDIHETVMAVLRVATKRQYTHVIRNLKSSMHWYQSYKKQVLAEFTKLEELYADIAAGMLSTDKVVKYLETSKHSSHEVLFALELFERCSYPDVIVGKQLVARASNALEFYSVIQI